MDQGRPTSFGGDAASERDHSQAERAIFLAGHRTAERYLSPTRLTDTLHEQQISDLLSSL